MTEGAALPLSTCTGDGCGRTIRWVLTEGGKRIPLDPDPHPDGNVIPVVVDGQRRARVLTGAQLPALEPAWMPHHATCPAAATFRRRKRATTPLCGICRTALDPVLAASGETAHPTCGAPSDLRATVAASLPARPADPVPAPPAADPDPAPLFDLPGEDTPR